MQCALPCLWRPITSRNKLFVSFDELFTNFLSTCVVSYGCLCSPGQTEDIMVSFMQSQQCVTVSGSQHIVLCHVVLVILMHGLLLVTYVPNNIVTDYIIASIQTDHYYGQHHASFSGNPYSSLVFLSSSWYCKHYYRVMMYHRGFSCLSSCCDLLPSSTKLPCGVTVTVTKLSFLGICSPSSHV